jgi:hypothetical protein
MINKNNRTYTDEDNNNKVIENINNDTNILKINTCKQNRYNKRHDDIFLSTSKVYYLIVCIICIVLAKILFSPSHLSLDKIKLGKIPKLTLPQLTLQIKTFFINLFKIDTITLSGQIKYALMICIFITSVLILTIRFYSGTQLKHLNIYPDNRLILDKCKHVCGKDRECYNKCKIDIMNNERCANSYLDPCVENCKKFVDDDRIECRKCCDKNYMKCLHDTKVNSNNINEIIQNSNNYYENLYDLQKYYIN